MILESTNALQSYGSILNHGKMQIEDVNAKLVVFGLHNIMLDLEWSKNASYFSLECDKVDIMSKSYLGGLGLLPPSLNKEKKRRAFSFQSSCFCSYQASQNQRNYYFLLYFLCFNESKQQPCRTALPPDTSRRRRW